MHKTTKIGCEELIRQAIHACQVSGIKNYITRNYIKNSNQWARWARQHSPLLLQVTSTNPLESYHSELKRTTSSKHGIIGIIQKIGLKFIYFFFNSYKNNFFNNKIHFHCKILHY